MPLRRLMALLALLAFCGAAPAHAQFKPAMSGALSHREPEMRRHGSGLVRPNTPRYHRRYYRRYYRRTR